jgi:hypothetical protein
MKISDCANVTIIKRKHLANSGFQNEFPSSTSGDYLSLGGA